MHNDDRQSRISETQARGAPRASQRAARTGRYQGSPSPQVAMAIAVGCVALLLIGGFMLIWSRGRPPVLPAQAAPATLGGVGTTPTPVQDGKQRLGGAIIAYGSPMRSALCAVLGAIEPGRSYVTREQRAGWLRLDVDGSGTVWTNMTLSETRVGVRDRLRSAIVAYATPPLNRQACGAIIGAIEPGRSFTVLEQKPGWSRLQVEGSGEIWTEGVVNEKK